MLSNARTAVKFLVYGLVIGLLFAPRSGKETRKELVNWAADTVKETIGSATGTSHANDTAPLDETQNTNRV